MAIRPRALLGEGIYDDVESLLAERVPDAKVEIKRYELSGAEVLGKWINAITPLLMAIGVACIYIEFQSPGFWCFRRDGAGRVWCFIWWFLCRGPRRLRALCYFCAGFCISDCRAAAYAGGRCSCQFRVWQ